MKVYAIVALGEYCCGQAIVAANTEQEAKDVLREATLLSYWKTIQWHKPESVEILPLTCQGDPRVVNHFEWGEK
jgi:hypothetical protein